MNQSTIDVKKAVTIAMQHAKEVLGPNLARLQLEEVELIESGSFWSVTIGFDDFRSDIHSVLGTPDRKYKVIEIDAISGQPRAIRIRKV